MVPPRRNDSKAVARHGTLLCRHDRSLHLHGARLVAAGRRFPAPAAARAPARDPGGGRRGARSVAQDPLERPRRRHPPEASTACRTCLGGDFAAAITPARSGAEPAQFFILAESGLPSSSALIIIYAELFLEVFSLAAVVLCVSQSISRRGRRARHAGGRGRNVCSDHHRHRRCSHSICRAETPVARRRAGRVACGSTGSGGAPSRRALRKLHTTVEFGRPHSTRGPRSRRSSRRSCTWRSSSPYFPHSCSRASLNVAGGATRALAARLPLRCGGRSGAGRRWRGGDGISRRTRTCDPHQLFAASLVWWRFYTFYIYILLGRSPRGTPCCAPFGRRRITRRKSRMATRLAVAVTASPRPAP